MKSTIKRIVTVSIVICAITLTAWGLYEIFHIKSTGTEQQLESVEELNSTIHSDKPLTDDEFIYGIANGIPKVDISGTEITALESNITQQLYNICKSVPTVEFVNYFGLSALRVGIDTETDIKQVCDIVDKSYGFERVYIEIHPVYNDTVTNAYLYEGGNLSQIVYDESGTSKNTDDIQDLISAITAEYSIDATAIQYTDSAFICSIDALTEADALNLFDFVYQWFRLSNKELRIVLNKEATVYASAQVDLADDRYEKFYPSSEIAPLFRMTYYKTMNFIYNGLRRTCDVYLG